MGIEAGASPLLGGRFAHSANLREICGGRLTGGGGGGTMCPKRW
jgi:hypothetical protein